MAGNEHPKLVGNLIWGIGWGAGALVLHFLLSVVFLPAAVRTFVDSSDPIWVFVACLVIIEAVLCAWISGSKRSFGAISWSAAAVAALFFVLVALRDERDLFYNEYVFYLAPDVFVGLPLGTAVAFLVWRLRGAPR